MSHSAPGVADEFLLRCLSARRGPLDGGREPVDWNGIFDLANNHRLTPVLYKRLKQHDAQAHVPADVWDRLRQVYVAGAVRSMCLERELRAVLRRLRGSGIEVIVLKGVFLAEAVYGDSALRPMADVDLLVRESDLGRTQAVLFDMGGTQPESKDIESCCRGESQLPPIIVRDLAIDIHWGIVPSTGSIGIDAAGLWSRARPATIAGVEVLALSPEDLLLHLCVHVCYQHRLDAGLGPFCDIAETIHHFRDKMDWALAVETARKWGAAVYVGLTLHLARGMLGAAVPDDVLEQLVPGGIDRRILETARRFVPAKTRDLRAVSLVDRWGGMSITGKARLLWERVFLTRGEMAATYPASRDSRHLYRYYMLRVRDVIRTYWSHSFRRGRLMAQSRGSDPNAALVNWLSGKS